jgi:hypothetical protein
MRVVWSVSVCESSSNRLRFGGGSSPRAFCGSVVCFVVEGAGLGLGGNCAAEGDGQLKRRDEMVRVAPLSWWDGRVSGVLLQRMGRETRGRCLGLETGTRRWSPYRRRERRG